MRSCDDIDEQALSYAEIKALCAGDPRIREKMDLDVQVAKLKVLRGDFQNQKYRLEDKLLKTFPEEIQKQKTRIAALQQDSQIAATHPQDKEICCGMTIKGMVYDDKKAAGERLLLARQEMPNADMMLLGTYRGFELNIRFDSFKNEHQIVLRGELSYPVPLGDDPRGNIVRLDNAIGNFADRIADADAALCRENGLSVVVPGKGSKGKSYAEYQAEKVGASWKGKLKITVDTLIPQVASFEELLQRLQAAGYEIKPGKYISCRAPGQERFTRLKTLGADYTEEAIKERIEVKRTKAAKAPIEQRGVSLLIDIENSIKAQESRGYEQWAKIHNLKLAAKTMNFLTEHKIEQYADLVSRIEEVNAENEKTADALKSVEKRLANMAVLMKHVTTYQKTKPVYEAYRRAKDKDAYRAKQESSLILHEAAAKALKTAGVSKLPNVAALQVDYEKLREQKEALYADYGKLKKQVKENDVIKQNIDSILRQPREPEREKGKERGE